jgi:hypothetical protein
MHCGQDCQIFLGKKYQNGENIPNDRKIYQIAIKYTNIFIPRPSKICPNIIQIGIFGLKIYHLATLIVVSMLLLQIQFVGSAPGLILI